MIAVVTRTALRLQPTSTGVSLRWPALCGCCGREVARDASRRAAAAPDAVAALAAELPLCNGCRSHTRAGWLAGVGRLLGASAAKSWSTERCTRAPELALRDGKAAGAIDLVFFHDEFARALLAANSDALTLVERGSVMVER